MKIQELFDKYVELCKTDDVEGCGDLVRDLEDKVCKDLYLKLSQDERTKEKLVKPLWFNYTTQQFRWDQ